MWVHNTKLHCSKLYDPRSLDDMLLGTGFDGLDAS